MKRFKKIRFKFKIMPIVILIILLLTTFFLCYINSNITPKLLQISSNSLDTYNNHLIMDFISNDTLSTSDLNNLIELVKNNNNEIIAIDYNIEKSYKVLKIITEGLYEIVSNTSYKDITDYDYEIKEDLVLFYPIGLASSFIYFNNLGPKVPVKIKFLSSLVTGITTKVSNYGINNVLLEIYVNVEITDNIVIPFKSESLQKKYDILLSSKVVMGNVPSYLGGTIQNSSPILQN
ncbi:MAG: sporulation protein YunB [Bacilli bacterium]|nr:sporulation protein YunB [Bacilli bacterium]